MGGFVVSFIVGIICIVIGISNSAYDHSVMVGVFKGPLLVL